MPSAIEDYALIGDCETAALVARDGSIDWLCLPRFDSGACFAALLGTPDNGRWQIAPIGEYRVTRRYREKTLILETQFDTDDGTVTLIDFMSMRGKTPEIIRVVRGDRGKVRMRMDFVVRFDYGQAIPWVTRQPDGALFAIAGPNLLALRTPVELRGEGLKTVSDFSVAARTTTSFGLTYGSSFGRARRSTDLKSSLEKTEKWWRKWASRCSYHGPDADAVVRSLITLKALTYASTGGILAAATTSLPEKLGGNRNWDYRYCWLRDATFSLLALMHGGYREEARHWRDWLLRAAAGSADQLQVMYGVAAERQIPESEVPWLPGYMGASPVRIGNAAAEQMQLDIYGEVADVLHHARTRTRSKSDSAMDLQRELLKHLEKIWREPDRGIWEFRGPGRQLTHSKVMAWVAFDRAIKSCERFGLDGDLDSWRATRQEIHDDVCQYGFDSERNTFVQSYGSKEVDASLLLIPLVGFLAPGDPRIAGTVQQIEKHLMRDGLVMRYDTEKVEDGLPSGEGAFLACTLWLADAYHLLGQNEKARDLLERVLRLRNDVGLLSEEYDPEKRIFTGNFPQAFSHVGLVNTIINLNMPSGPARQRSGSRGHNSKPPH